MAGYGFFLYGPILAAWYHCLDRFVSGTPGVPVTAVATKVALSQALLNPALIALVFAYNYAWMRRLPELPEKCRRDLLPTICNGWRFWVPVSVTSFAAVPARHRVLFTSSCSLAWNCYLSATAAL